MLIAAEQAEVQPVTSLSTIRTSGPSKAFWIPIEVQFFTVTLWITLVVMTAMPFEVPKELQSTIKLRKYHPVTDAALSATRPAFVES